MESELSDLLTELPHGVRVLPLPPEAVDHVRDSSKSETMTSRPGEGIKEHTHGLSMYFAKNAVVTLNGRPYEIPYASLVVIPPEVPHGWQHSGNGSEDAVITSFDEGHDTFELYGL